MANGKWRKYLVTTAVIIAALIAAVLLGAVLGRWKPRVPPDAIIQAIRAFGVWGVLVSIGIMIFHSFVPFPGELVAIANGMAYGAFWGTVITWTGAMLGAFLSFGLTRKFGRPFVRKLLSKKKLHIVDEWVARYGGSALFISRFAPFIAFSLINYVAGLTNVSWWTFAWTTGLGILPMTVLMVVMGKGITTMPWKIWLFVLAAGLLLGLLVHRLFLRQTGTPPGKHTSGSDDQQ